MEKNPTQKIKKLKVFLAAQAVQRTKELLL
jgi:hypothetical protein